MDDFTTTEQYRKCQEIFARSYPDFRNAGEQYRDLIAEFVTDQTLVLDLGCGRTSLAAEQIQSAGISVGVDMSFSDLEHNQIVTYRVLADGEALAFSDDSFDLIVSQWSVEHFANPRLVFGQIARVLRPGGKAVLFTTNAYNYIPVLSRFLGAGTQRLLISRLLRRAEHESFATYYRANTVHGLRRMCEEVGLRPTEIRYVGNPFYLAFSPWLFHLALLFEKVTDMPSLNRLKLYMLCVLQ